MSVDNKANKLHSTNKNTKDGDYEYTVKCAKNIYVQDLGGPVGRNLIQ